MNEQFISQWGGLILLLALCANFFIYGFVNWKTLKGDLKPFTVLDISTITAIISLVFLRVASIVCYKPDFFSAGWKMIPQFFTIDNGQFAYTGLVLGLILSTNLIFRSSNQLKSIRFLLDKITISIAIVTFIDMVVLGLFIIGGYNIANQEMVVGALILSILTMALSRTINMVERVGLLSAIFIILAAVVAIGINIIHSSTTGVWQIELESILALVLIVYGIIELVSSLPKADVDEAEEDQVTRKNRTESMQGGSPLKYSQSYAKNDDVFGDFSFKDKFVSRVKNLKRKSK